MVDGTVEDRKGGYQGIFNGRAKELKTYIKNITH